MKTALDSLPPEKIMAADDPARNQPDRGRLMFERLGEKTAALVADGCRCLVRLWESAWHEGGAPAASEVEMKLMSERELQGLYRSSRFLPAFGIQTMAGELDRCSDL